MCHRLCRYFDGRHHLEEMMFYENIRRSQLLIILDKFYEVLVISHHEEPNISYWLYSWSIIAGLELIVLILILRTCVWCCYREKVSVRVLPVRLMNVEQRQALLIYLQFWLELFCNAQQYNQTGVSWPTGSWLKHSDWLHLRLMNQSQEILLGHAIFASSEYGYRGYHRIARSISNNALPRVVAVTMSCFVVAMCFLVKYCKTRFFSRALYFANFASLASSRKLRAAKIWIQ